MDRTELRKQAEAKRRIELRICEIFGDELIKGVEFPDGNLPYLSEDQMRIDPGSLVIEFCNGNKVEFQTSEWGSISSYKDKDVELVAATR